MSLVNFTTNDSISNFGNYLGNGLLNTLGSPDMVGVVVMFMVVVFCFLVHLSADASVFLVTLAIVLLALGGFLPLAFYYVALILIAVLGLAWVVFKVFRL